MKITQPVTSKLRSLFVFAAFLLCFGCIQFETVPIDQIESGGAVPAESEGDTAPSDSNSESDSGFEIDMDAGGESFDESDSEFTVDMGEESHSEDDGETHMEETADWEIVQDMFFAGEVTGVAVNSDESLVLTLIDESTVLATPPDEFALDDVLDVCGEICAAIFILDNN